MAAVLIKNGEVKERRAAEADKIRKKSKTCGALSVGVDGGRSDDFDYPGQALRRCSDA